MSRPSARMMRQRALVSAAFAAYEAEAERQRVPRQHGSASRSPRREPRRRARRRAGRSPLPAAERRGRGASRARRGRHGSRRECVSGSDGGLSPLDYCSSSGDLEYQGKWLARSTGEVVSIEVRRIHRPRDTVVSRDPRYFRGTAPTRSAFDEHHADIWRGHGEP